MTVNFKGVSRILGWVTVAVVGGASLMAQNSAGAGQSAPDNTRINTRDQSSTEATADRQKENAGDRAITQQIRKSLLQDKSLSVYAHNVKIVTQDGNVVLKGPVRSMEEKKSVEAKAIAVAGEDRVSSQLQVAAK